MFFSLLNAISSATDVIKVDDECEYNGYTNKNLYLHVKYEYIDKNNDEDDCFSIRNNNTNKNMHYKPIYKWFLNDDSCITTSDNKTYKIKVEGDINDKMFGVPIEMIDCEIVYNFSSSNNNMTQMGYKQNSTEVYKVSLLKNSSNIQNINFAHGHLLFMDKLHPMIMDVKNDKFKQTKIPVIDTFKTLRIQNRNNLSYTNFYTFISDADKEKMQSNITGDAVFICSVAAFNNLDSFKKVSATYVHNFKSFKRNNKIKIKEVPENVSFEEIEFPNEHSELLEKYEEQLPKAIEILNAAINTTIDVDKKEYAEILKSLCLYAFDPTVCENDETIKHLKILFDLIYSLFQALHKDQFDKGSKPLFPAIDVSDEKYIDGCLLVFNYYLSFFDKLNVEQRHQYKNACVTIDRILTTHDELKTIITDESNLKCAEFKRKINDIKLFDPIKDAQDLLNEMNELEKDMDAARIKKLITKEQLAEIEKRYKNIKEKMRKPYALGNKNIQMKIDSLKFDDFIAEMTKTIKNNDYKDNKNASTGEVNINDNIDNKNTMTDILNEPEKENSTNTENENRIELKEDSTGVDSSKTKTKSILLIVFGSLVGVGIAIGCGVYCYIRKKRIEEKKKYEKFEFVRSI